VDDWFGEFRGGLYGLYARLHGLSFHYERLHAWLLHERTRTETECDLAILFFCMDSAIECCTFALNALGYAAFPQGFRNIKDEVALRRIKPADVTDVANVAV
jgi:hypothetical protein